MVVEERSKSQLHLDGTWAKLLWMKLQPLCISPTVRPVRPFKLKEGRFRWNIRKKVFYDEGGGGTQEQAV